MKKKKRKPIVVLIDCPGRLCNRLMLHARIAAFCLEYGFELYDANLPEMKDVTRRFSCLPQQSQSRRQHRKLSLMAAISFLLGLRSIDLEPQGLSLWRLWMRKYLLKNHEKRKRHKLSCEDDLRMRGGRFFFLRGYLFNVDVCLVQKHYNQIRSSMGFSAEIVASAEAILQSADVAHIKIGVHCRRTDYRWYREGRYFFDWDAYSRWMVQLESIFEGRGITFFFCSDEVPPEDAGLAMHKLVMGSPDNPLVDLALLSKMDYIIGPPSTFSGWASFYGQVPIMHLQSRSEDIDLEKFSVSQVAW